MAEAGFVPVKDRQNRIARRAARVVADLGLVRNVARSLKGPIFVAMMGLTEERTLPFAYSNELIPYAFDCWPPIYDRWVSFFTRHRVRLAFFSARQSADHFAKAMPAMRAHWLPEAVDPAEYGPGSALADRRIDVLEMGRRHEGFHRSVTDALAALGRIHRFEDPPGRLVFPSRASLRDGLSTSRIAVCFPRSMTHPGATAGLETVTHRYFEAIASRCVVLGHAPDELVELFGFNPVVEVMWGQEAAQLAAILEDPRSLQDRVDANYNRLLEVATWRHRVPVILEAIVGAGLTSSTRGAGG
jgi:hypothetical protein